MGIAVPTLARAAFARVAAHHSSSARAIYYGARQLGAILGVSLAVILIDRREAFHSSRLIDGLFSRNLSTIGVAPGNTLAVRKLASALARQSLVLTYAEVFYAMAALSAVTLLFLSLLPSLESAAGHGGCLGRPLLRLHRWRSLEGTFMKPTICAASCFALSAVLLLALAKAGAQSSTPYNPVQNSIATPALSTRGRLPVTLPPLPCLLPILTLAAFQNPHWFPMCCRLRCMTPSRGRYTPIWD